jgi:hypothetical protein
VDVIFKTPSRQLAAHFLVRHMARHVLMWLSRDMARDRPLANGVSRSAARRKTRVLQLQSAVARLPVPVGVRS